MKFQRLTKQAPLEVAADAGIDPSEAARAINQVDRDNRDAVLSAMGAGATADDAVDAAKRGVNMSRYTEQVGYNRPHEEAIRRSNT